MTVLPAMSGRRLRIGRVSLCEPLSGVPTRSNPRRFGPLIGAWRTGRTLQVPHSPTSTGRGHFGAGLALVAPARYQTLSRRNTRTRP